MGIWAYGHMGYGLSCSITFGRYLKAEVGSTTTTSLNINGKRKRHEEAGTAVDLTVPMENYHECVQLVRD